MEYLLPENFGKTCDDYVYYDDCDDDCDHDCDGCDGCKDFNNWYGKYELPKKIVTIHTDKILSELELFSYLCRLHGSNDADIVIKEYTNMYDNQLKNILQISEAFNAYRKNAVRLDEDDKKAKVLALEKITESVTKDFSDDNLNPNKDPDTDS